MENEDFIGYLSEEKSLIDSNIKDIDDLYDEVKNHLDAVKRSNSRGTLNFIQGQTSNLISLKTAKSNLVNTRINIKKLEAELTLKKQAKEDKGEGGNAEMVMQLAKEILNTKEQKPTEKIIDKKEEDSDLLLEQRLSLLESQGEIQYTDNDKRIKYENDGIELIIVKKNDKWKFVAMDRNNKIVKDYLVPKQTDVEISFITDAKGRLSAKDENGNTYKVKEVKGK